MISTSEANFFSGKKKKGIECGISLRVILVRHLWYKRSIPLKQGFGIFTHIFLMYIETAHLSD